MCEHGDTMALEVKVAAHLAAEGVDTWKTKPIDRCIAPLVAALQKGGIDMLGSCCGHGSGEGSILLADGRELRVSAKRRTQIGWVKFDGDEYHDFRYFSPVDRHNAERIKAYGYVPVYADEDAGEPPCAP